MLKLRTLLSILIISILLAGCGYVEDEPVKDSRILVVGDLQSGCKIDTDKIKNIFKENITDQLDCVQSQLEKFKYVKTDNREILTQADITIFVQRYFSNNPQDIIDGLTLLFKLNTLLLKDEPGQMKVSNIKPFFDLLKIVNRDSVLMIELFDKMKDETDKRKFMANRSLLEQTILKFSGSITGIIQTRTGRSQSINIEDLILELTKNLKDFKLGKELLNSLLFVKKLFLGGSRIYISTIESTRLFTQFPVYAMNIFDIFLLKEKYFETEAEYFEHLATNLESLKKNIFPHQNEEIILTILDLDRIIDEFFKDEPSFGDIFGNSNKVTSEKIKVVIKAFKKDLVGGSQSEFSYRDIEVSLAFINVAIRSFEKISKILDLVKDIENKDLSEKLQIKNTFLKTFNELSVKVKELIDGNQDIPIQVELLSFIETLATKTDIIKLEPQLINSMFSIKVASVGGTRPILTINEFIKGLERAEDFAKLYFDLQFLATDYFELSDKAKFLFFERQVYQLSTLLLSESEVEKIISIADIDIIIDQFFNKDDELEKGAALKVFARNFKENVLRTSNDYLNIKEVKSSVSLGYLAFKTMVFIKFHGELKEQVDNKEKTISAAKSEYNSEFNKITNELRNILAEPSFINSPIELLALLTELENSKAIFTFDTEILKSALTFKSMFLGGVNSKIDRSELLYLTNVGSKISDSLFDLTFNNLSDFTPKKGLYKLILENLRNIRSIIPKVIGEVKYFDLKEALKFADLLVKAMNDKSDTPKSYEDLIKPSNFKRTIIDLTQRAILTLPRAELSYPAPCQLDKTSEKPVYICSQDDPANAPEIDMPFTNTLIESYLEIVDQALQTMYFADVTFDYFKTDLASPNPVTINKYPTLSEYNILDPEYSVIIKNSFSDVALNNKYFRDGNNNPVYQREIIRNKEGFTNLVLMRTLLPYALVAYGKEGNNEDPTTSEGLETHELQDMLVGIKSVLSELGLWTSSFKTFGENILLLSDLFQSRSNGDLRVNLNEASEFVELIFTAGSLGSRMLDELSILCPVQDLGDNIQRANSKCARKEFFNVLFDKLNLGTSYPRLKLYIDSEKKENKVIFVEGVEGFARDVPSLDQPWELRDITLVLGAMLNIESTFLRFDTIPGRKYDNRLDFNELKVALNLYDSAILKIAPEAEKYVRTVFFYMVKYMKLPETDLKGSLNIWALDKIFKRHFKDTVASRLNISRLLFFMVDSRKADEDKKVNTLTQVKDFDRDDSAVSAFASAASESTGESIEDFFDAVSRGYDKSVEFIGL